MTSTRLITFSLLLASWLAVAADPQPGEYCAQPAAPRNQPQDLQCFDSLEKAERHLRLEPGSGSSSKSGTAKGFRFLEFQPPEELLGNKRVRKYNIPIQPVEEYLGDFYQMGGDEVVPGPIPRSSKASAGCGPVPYLGTNAEACDTEDEAVAKVLAGYPYYDCTHPTNGCDGHVVVGQWFSQPPRWSGSSASLSPNNVAHVVVDFTPQPVDDHPNPRRLAIHFTVENNNSEYWRVHESIRKEVHFCPEGLNANSHTTPGRTRDFPWVCIANLSSTITYVSEKQDVCQKEGSNPCSPSNGAKEYSESDFTYNGVTFSRAYNSLEDGQSLKGFPAGKWYHTFTPSMSTRGVSHTDSRGYVHPYRGSGASRFVSTINDLDTIFTQSNGTRTLHSASGSIQTFDASGRLTSSIEPNATASYTIDYCDSTDILLGTCDAEGHIHRVDFATGRSLRFLYSEHQTSLLYGGVSHRYALDQILSDDNQALVSYEYDSLGRLTAAERSPSDRTTYHYGEAGSVCQSSSVPSGPCDPSDFALFLTRVVRPEGDVRVYTYDVAGNAISTTLSLPETATVLDYPSSNAATALRASGALATYTFQSTPPNRPLSKAVVDSVTGATKTETWTYDSAGRRKDVTHANGAVTKHFYDTYLQTRVEEWSASGGTKLRTTISTRDIAGNRVVSRVVKNASNVIVSNTAWTRNARGQVLTSTQTNPSNGATRSTSISYCEQADVDVTGSTCPILGLLKSVDGPRTDVSDVTTYAYYPDYDDSGCDTGGSCHGKGDLWKVTNALGHVTETLRYDRAGRVMAAMDANGVITEFSYHPRGWLLTRTVKGATVPEDAVTTFTYDAAGQVTRVAQPDGDFLDYEYDAAHRLTAIEDALGNRIDYTLDGAGNRTAEATADSTTAIKRSLSRVYDQLGRLKQQLDAYSRVTEFDYDASDNQTDITDALLTDTSQEYDPLNRLRRSLQDVGGLEVETEYGYDALDRLTRVTDPKGLHTDYGYDGLGNLLTLTSPDTGVTTYTYDAAGNRLTQTDARGITATYAYDALNRLTSISYVDTSQNVSFAYDQPSSGKPVTYPIGRLTSMTDASGNTSYRYDRRGNVIQKVQVAFATSTIGYTYSPGDRLVQISYPSGSTIHYVYDGAGRVVNVNRSKPVSNSIVNTVSYLPFGPITQIAFDGGATLDFVFDQNYWIDAVGGTALALDLGTNELGNITSLADATPANARSFEYDTLSRLTDVDDGNAALIEAFSYDATGNRLSKQTTSGTQSYGYAAGNHRLASIDATARGYDAMGSLTSRGDGWTFEYDARQRLKYARLNGTPQLINTYNGKGERVGAGRGAGFLRKDYTYFYDEAGRLLAEYRTIPFQNLPPVLEREYVWLGDRPVAILVHDGGYAGEILHVHSDHLGTPRAVTRPDANNAVVWRWDLRGPAFGDHAPLEDPDGDSTAFVLNLRYPGQYFDAESGLYYNYFRDYEAGTGRYVESDPIGLDGGISAYGYAFHRPTGSTDPLGLAPQSGCCAAAIRAGLDRNSVDPSHRDTGFVACCNGVKFSCYNVRSDRVSDPVAFEIIETCGTGHEDTHKPKVTCPACGDVSRPSWDTNDPFVAGANECLAYGKQLRCLERKRRRCTTPECSLQVGAEISRARSAKAAKCGGFQQ